MSEPTILIIEDEPAIAENIRFALQTEGFAVCWQIMGGETAAFEWTSQVFQSAKTGAAIGRLHFYNQPK